MSVLQRTRLSKVQNGVGRILAEGVVGPWWLTSLRLIALLFGFFSASVLAGSLTSVVPNLGSLSNFLPTRNITALIAVGVCELLVFFRQVFCKNSVPLHWRLLDNLRIGFVYAVILEAFKVGS